MVSIPYRYGITKKKNLKIMIFLSYLVSIPYRYGITQYFRHFQTVLYFFFLKSIQKVCLPYFLLSPFFLIKSRFFSKTKILPSIDRLLGKILQIFQGFSLFFHFLKCHFLQCFQCFRGRQTFLHIFIYLLLNHCIYQYL